MERFTNEELLDVLPIGFKESRIFTKKQKLVMGQLLMLNGLEESKKNGYCYRSNELLCKDCGIESEHTLIAAARKLELYGMILRKKGSRTDGASEYIVFEDKLKEYYDGITANCSVNCSDVDITAKNTDRNCSEKCSTDKDIEIDKELDIIIYNILKYINKKTLINKLNSILEETVREKELEEREAEVAMKESQPVKEETIPDQDTTPSEVISIASAPVENESQAPSPVTSIDEETTQAEEPIPTEEEQYQQWFQVHVPYLKRLEEVQTLGQFIIIKDMLKQIGGEYLDKHEYITQTVIQRMNKTLGNALRARKKVLLPDEMELSDYLRVHN